MFLRCLIFVLFVAMFSANAAEPALAEAEGAIKKFRLPAGFKAELFAAEPMLANPVAFSIDEKGRVFVAETYRHSAVGPAYRYYEGVFDIRSHMDWLEQDLASRTVEDRVELLRRNLGTNFAKLSVLSEQVRLLEDTNKDGRADVSKIFAQGFNRPADGIGAGVLARHGDVYYTCIPDLWLLKDRNGDGVADARESLHSGFGVHIAFLGHDLHGLRIGPDGRLYFSIGDRGLNLVTREGKPLIYPDEGTVLRCELDGSNLEVFVHGLRNPQELAFNDVGDLFTGDNNSDGGDRARWVHLVEGGDSGWRIGYQTLNEPVRRGPWNGERLWQPHFEGQAAYIVPPVANLGYGPSGVTYYPGTGLPEKYRGHFFLCDFRGGASSGIHSFDLRGKGASFELGDYEQFVWETLPTDVEFGPEPGIYFSDWVEGWNKTGKGRIYHVFDPAISTSALASTKQWLGANWAAVKEEQLKGLLSHPDQRVRMEAQFALVAMGERGVRVLSAVLLSSTNAIEALHAVWGLGQAARKGNAGAAHGLLFAAGSRQAEVRAQVAKCLGETAIPEAGTALLSLLGDSEPRVKFFAALSLGRLKYAAAQGALMQMIDENQNRDVYLRHAGIMGLVGIGDRAALKATVSSGSPTRRLAACVALRKLGDAGVAEFLNDGDLGIVVEAARAINDVPIDGGTAALAEMISRTNLVGDLRTMGTNAPRSAVEAGISAVAVDTGTTTPVEQFFLRVINAQFRLGGDTNAEALARFAGLPRLSGILRSEALNALADWGKPPGRDRVTGLWRPLPARDAAPARKALAGSINAVLDEPAGIEAARKLKITEAGPRLVAMAKTNAAALEAVAVVAPKELAGALDVALASGNVALESEAIRIQAGQDPNAALKWIKEQLDAKDLAKQRAAITALGILPEGESDKILTQEMDRALQKKIAPELVLDVLDAAGKRSSREVLNRVEKFEKGRNADDQLAPFEECLVGGDAKEGRKIFFERAEVFCSRCHQINGDGGEAGPKLTGIGSRQNRSYILESIIFPNNKIAQGWENVIVTLKDGRSFAGKVTKETDSQLFLNSPEDGDVKVAKDEIKSRNRALSAMPDEFRQILTKQEIRNLVEFLAEQK